MPAISSPKLDPCWLAAPPENMPGFFTAFVGISMAVQIALRERLPEAYFENSDSFRHPRTAYPMLIYQASRPYRGKNRTDLTYDVMNPKMLARLVRMTKKSLIKQLGQVEARLCADGLRGLAGQYAPKRGTEIMKAVQRVSRSRRYLNLLIRSESVLVDALVQLSGLGNLPPKEQRRRLALFWKKWNFQLRRFYPRADATCLAPVLLDAATQALQSFLETWSLLHKTDFS